MSERVLTQRELNRALLSRQLLLERVDLSIPKALEMICGIQNQYAPNAYIRLWSMLDGFKRDDLDRAYEQKSVVQATLLRGTIHTVAATDYRLFAPPFEDRSTLGLDGPTAWTIRIGTRSSPASATPFADGRWAARS